MMLLVSAPRYTLSLMENATDFLSHGLERYRARLHPSDLKRTVIGLAQAVELFLKARLEKVHPLLVFVDPARVGDDAPTVDLSTAAARLIAAGVILTQADVALLTSLKRLRNRLVHYRIDATVESIETTVGSIFAFLDTFCAKELGLILADHVSPEALFFARKAAASYEDALRMALERVATDLQNIASSGSPRLVLQCPDCGSNTVVFPAPNTVPRDAVRCYLCDERHKVVRCRYCGGNSLDFPVCDACASQGLD
jgi:ribosomal protein S27E